MENQVTNPETVDTQNVWAFAVDTAPPARRRPLPTRPMRNLNRYRITACSRQAKAYGVREGMAYGEAISIIPNMRLIVCNRK